MKVLIVEDDEQRAEQLQMYLQSKSVQVVTAPNGFEAMRYLKRNVVNLILSDISMPYMDGFNLAKNAKKEFNDTPLFIYSARQISEDNKDLAMELGVDKCLKHTDIKGIGDEALTLAFS